MEMVIPMEHLSYVSVNGLLPKKLLYPLWSDACRMEVFYENHRL